MQALMSGLHIQVSRMELKETWFLILMPEGALNAGGERERGRREEGRVRLGLTGNSAREKLQTSSPITQRPCKPILLVRPDSVKWTPTCSRTEEGKVSFSLLPQASRRADFLPNSVQTVFLNLLQTFLEEEKQFLEIS